MSTVAGGQAEANGARVDARAALGLVVGLAVTAGILAFFVWQSFYDHAADFKSFYSAGYAARDRSAPLYDLVALDENPFGEVFKLPPTAAVYLVPVSFGTVQQARLTWRLVLVVAFLAAYAILARAFAVRALSPFWLVGLAAWAVFGPLQIAVGEGQWDPIFLLCFVLSTVGVADRRTGLAAVPIAVAATIKPYPILLAGLFVARRWWRALLMTAGVCVVLSAIGCLIVGLHESTVFLTQVLPASGATTAYADNQALGGVLARLVSDDLKPFPLRSAIVDVAIRAVAVVGLVLTIWIVARAQRDDRLGRALELGLFVPLAILVVPAAWSHYQTILLVPLSLLAIGMLRSNRHEYVGWALLAATYLLLMLPNPSMLYGGDVERNLWLRSKADGANLALQHLYPGALHRLVLSYKALGAMLLYAMVAWRLLRGPSSGDEGAALSEPLTSGLTAP